MFGRKKIREYEEILDIVWMLVKSFRAMDDYENASINEIYHTMKRFDYFKDRD